MKRYLSLCTADSNSVEVLSLSSGVGTGSSSQSGSGSGEVPAMGGQPQQPPVLAIRPGMHVVCLENHSSNLPGSLHITQGDVIEGKMKIQV